MDFHRLVATLNEISSRPLDKTLPGSKIVNESPAGAPGPAQAAAPQTGPTMNLTLNARTMDDIESMMRLIQKVNPDVPNTTSSTTALTAEPSIAKVDTDFEIDGLDSDDNALIAQSSDMDDMDDMDSLTPSDLDADDMDGLSPSDLDADDSDALDNELNDIEEDGGFQSATTEPNERYKSIDYMTNRLSGGMNGPKNTFPKVAGGDNPMQRMKESEEAFKEGIRADLRRRLEESKKPSAGMSKKAKSAVVKKAKSGGDIGKPGKNFDKVAKSAGGGEKGKRIAAAAMWKQQAKK